MIPFEFARSGDVAAAVAQAAATSNARYIGGGTNLVDLMRQDIEHPDRLVDVRSLPRRIEVRPDGSMLVGASVTNTQLAAYGHVRQAFPLLSRAILAGASAQIRNMATVGGNILQRTRCQYFFDKAARCNKRNPGSGCDAIEGFDRNHAVLGASSFCVATHPSDMCVALAALDAVVHVEGPDGGRTVDIVDLHRLPEDTPEIETRLVPGELIAAVEVPALPPASRSAYRKVRDRSSYAFALVSVAASVTLDGSGMIGDVRLGLGGVAHRPWRARKAEAFLRGMRPTEENFANAAALEMEDAVGLRDNTFKIDLARRTIAAVLLELTGETR